MKLAPDTKTGEGPNGPSPGSHSPLQRNVSLVDADLDRSAGRVASATRCSLREGQCPRKLEGCSTVCRKRCNRIQEEGSAVEAVVDEPSARSSNDYAVGRIVLEQGHRIAD